MPIDLTDRIIQSPPPRKALKLHPIRRAVQIAMGAAIVLLPLLNILRVDVTSGYFWLLGQKFTAQNMILLFYSCALGVLLLLSVSMVYGRWWCGWICPQTLASDFGDSLKARIKIWTRGFGKGADALSYGIWAFTMTVISIGTAASTLSFFYPSSRVWTAVMHPLSDHRVISHLIVVTTIILANLLFVRRAFCRRGCPYGLMLSVIGDKNTMTVRYLWERNDDCISCGKCVTVCPMGIDIKRGANQMECIGCGECIDACNDILPLVRSNPKPGLIELRYGIDPMRRASRLTFAQKIGLWDFRRVFVCTISVIFATGLGFSMFGTRPTTVTVVPSGTIFSSSELLFERYDVNIANGKPRSERFSITAIGIDHLYSFQAHPSIAIARSSQRTVRLTVAAPMNALTAGCRYPITIIVRSLDKSNDRHSVTTFFYVPEHQVPLKAV